MEILCEKVAIRVTAMVQIPLDRLLALNLLIFHGPLLSHMQKLGKEPLYLKSEGDHNISTGLS